MEDLMKMPQKAIVNRFLAKNRFYTMADMTTAQQRIFTQDLERMTLIALFNRESTNISPYKDEHREYNEVAVLSAELRKKESAEIITKLIMSAIPYPALVVLYYEDELSFAVAHHRINLADSSKDVLEEIYSTQFTGSYHKTLEKLSYPNLDKGNMFGLYSSIVDVVIGENLERRNILATTPEQSRQMLEQIEKLETEIEGLKAQLKKEPQFNKKMELNIQIKKLEEKLEQWEG